MIRIGKDGETIKGSRLHMFCKLGVLKNFAKFKGKQLCWSFFFIEVAAIQPAALIKKRLRHRGFRKFLEHLFCRAYTNVFNMTKAEDWSLHTYHFITRDSMTTAQILANNLCSLIRAHLGKRLWISLFRL